MSIVVTGAPDHLGRLTIAQLPADATTLAAARPADARA